MPSSNRFGRPLREALQTYTALAQWAEWERLEKSTRGLVVVRGAGRAENVLVEARNRQWANMERAFRKKLVSAELVATAVAAPLQADTVRTIVSSDLWHVLQPDFRNSAARGGGLILQDVLVATAEETAEKYRPPNNFRIPKKGLGERYVGRPTAKPAVEMELKRRAAAGVLHATLAEEARHLSAWASARAEEGEWPHDRPTPKTVENQIRHLFRKLKV